MVANSFFDCLSSILSNKKYWMDSQNEGQYNPIGVNIGLSQHLDSILYVNEMNKNWQVVTPRMNYDYYFYSIRRMFRKYSKWAKKFKDEDITMLMEYYQVNKVKAQDYLSILNEEQLTSIRKEFYEEPF